MKKFYTLALAASLATCAIAQQLPEDGKYYHLVSGFQPANTNLSDARRNACFGVRTIDNVEYYGINPYSASDDHQLWKFVAKPNQAAGETTLYAMVNKAGEYVPALGSVFNISGNNVTVYQNTRYEVKTLENGVIPDDAYTFSINAAGIISEENLTKYDATIHGMKAGDTYITICPQKYRCSIENPTSEEYVVDNIEANPPQAPDTKAANPPYYLNAAGSGRNFAINLWFLESAPTNSEYWVIIPENTEPAPAPEPISGPELGVYYHLVSGFKGNSSSSEQRPNACFGIKADGETNYYGITPYAAEDAHQQWTFIPDPNAADGETPLYAMVNRAGEYVPELGTIMSNYSGAVYQDTRFLVETASADNLPADAYAFSITVVDTIKANNVNNYDSSIHGIKVGDKYILIKPAKYRSSKNNPTDDQYIVDNDAQHAPQAPTAAFNPPYYLAASGNGRNFYVHLWYLETEQTPPASSQHWILVPIAEVAEPVAPETPAITSSIQPVNGVVAIPENGTATVTITAEDDAKVAYAFLPSGSTDDITFNVMETNTATLRIDKAGELKYYAVRGSLTSETATLSFKLDDKLASITEISGSDNAPAAIFDLQGRKVASPKKGLYIINGKKVLTK